MPENELSYASGVRGMERTGAATADETLLKWLKLGLEREASDLHLVVGHPPTHRIHGRLVEADAADLTAEQTRRFILSLMPAPLRDHLAEHHDFDFSYTLEEDGEIHRFRVNVFQELGTWGAAIRYTPGRIPTLEWMQFPQDLAARIVNLPGGLVLITGVTGSGKTTTLAKLVDLIIEQGHRRIITVEQPIEYLFTPRAHSVVSQREVGVDVPSFADGLKFGLRQDPDVILVGEVRDSETARMVISAAETGHLVLTTVHTRDARGAITRMVDIFPSHRQDDIRAQLALSLQIIVSQHLLPSVNEGEKRVLATEVLIASDSIRSAIRLNKIETIDNAIQTGKRYGMHTLDEDLQRLFFEQKISSETARKFSKSPA